MLSKTPASLLPPSPTVAELTARFRAAFRSGVQAIITAGQVIRDGKDLLDHGQFLDWVENELRLGARKAQMLQNIAAHPVLANANHWYAFPVSWRSLFELTLFDDAELLAF